ncbi:MAG: YceD family protein [Longimicrobiales bacterium]
MLELDLARLRGHRSLQLAWDVPADAALLDGDELCLSGPLHVEMEAQLAGSDVVVRGRVQSTVRAECRRCLKELELPLAENIAALYTASLDEDDDAGAADAEDVYPLARNARTLNLGPMVRELVLLSVPAFAVCDDECRGLCPGCGIDLNEGECECEAEAVDARWTPFRELERD